jgi:putative chitinase
MNENLYIKLKGYIPNQIIAKLSGIVAINTPSGGNTNLLRMAHFLAQCSHESGGFKLVEENLNYSADGLLKTFPKYFTSAEAGVYAHHAERIASRVYAGRMGNDDEASGDGYTFRGRGYIQLTGKSNYARFGEFVGADTVADPDLVASQYPLASAGFFFDSNHIWPICDQGYSDSVITAVTKKVNGGTRGLPDRTRLFNDYYALLQ